MEPIACILTPAALRERVGSFAALETLSREEIRGGVRTRYALADEARVRALVAAEAECCAFLEFAVAREAGALRVDVTGPPEARPAIDLISPRRASAGGRAAG
jgi:hypothetical protein